MNNSAYTLCTVIVPANAVGGEERLIEARSDDFTSGLCRTVEEAQRRIEALLPGWSAEAITEAPDYQANTKEMTEAWERLQTVAYRDGGQCRKTVEAAMKAGIHTVEWALASRYLVAGW